MDSVNLLESQSSPLNFRSTASNTIPFRCPCGGLNEHAQAFLRAFRPSNPGQSQCKHSQDAEEKFPVQQHFYPSLPFVSPIFYNSSLTNLYCPHNPPPETPAKEQPANKPGNVFHPKEKCHRTNNGPEEEDARKNSNVLGPETQFFGHPFCFPNANGSGLGQRCGCGDSHPWACGSLIVPMISYCVFWNSMKSNTNFPSGSPPDACQQIEATVNQSNTSTDLPPTTQANDLNNNSTEISGNRTEVEGVTGTEWRSQEERVEDIEQGTTRSYKSLASSFEKESGSYNTEENSEKNERHLEVGSDDSEEISDEDQEEDEEGDDCEIYDWADENKNEQEKTSISNVYFSSESQSFMKETESQPPSAPGSCTDLKKLEKNKTPMARLSCTDVKLNPTDSTAEGEKALRSRITNHNVQEKLERQSTQARKAVCIKKFINNFTMTDQTNRVHEEAQTSAAAAGDLGGVNCIGYKINVSNSFHDREFEILEGRQTVEKAKSKEICVKDLSHTEEGSDSAKVTEKTTKNVRHFRSGIAKLLTSPKLKDTKTDPVKNAKTETTEQAQKELTLGKRRHSCFPTDTTARTSEKAQQIKNYRLAQGSDRQQHQKMKPSNRETLRKQEKNLKEKLIKEAVKK